MKTALLVAVVLLWPGIVYCESQVVHLTTQSRNLPEGIVDSWGRQKDFFIRNNFEIIDWEEAKILLADKRIRGGKQYHTGLLTIYTMEGNKYLTQQPEMDAFLDLMKEKGLNAEGFGTE